MFRRRVAHHLLIAAALVVAGTAMAEPPSRAPRTTESRAVWLARLAAEGRRPVRLAWRRDGQGASAADPFARLTLDVKGATATLSPYVAEPERWSRVMEALAAGSTCPCTVWGALPGRVPDGRVVLGSPLRVGKSGGNVALSWGASCSDGATDYTVHQGTIGTWYNHTAVDCTTDGVTGTTLTAPAGSSYFLIVPVTDDAEGSYGRNRAGQERPNSSSVCRKEWVTHQCR